MSHTSGEPGEPEWLQDSDEKTRRAELAMVPPSLKAALRDRGFVIVPRSEVPLAVDDKCQAGSDGDCTWTDCPQQKFYQSGCPFRAWDSEER